MSFTFRKVRGIPCECNYPQHCDSKKSQDKPLPPTTMLPSSQSEAAELEKKHVHEVYENIAEHFSGTRHSPWPNIAEFLRKQPPGSLIADVGCGNGMFCTPDCVYNCYITKVLELFSSFHLQITIPLVPLLLPLSIDYS